MVLIQIVCRNALHLSASPGHMFSSTEIERKRDGARGTTTAATAVLGYDCDSFVLYNELMS